MSYDIGLILTFVAPMDLHSGLLTNRSAPVFQATLDRSTRSRSTRRARPTHRAARTVTVSVRSGRVFFARMPNIRTDVASFSLSVILRYASNQSA